jgi:hypothetical protein
MRRDGDHNSVIFVNPYLVSRSCIDQMKFIIDYHEGHHGCFHNCGSVVINGHRGEGHFRGVVVLGGRLVCDDVRLLFLENLSVLLDLGSVGPYDSCFDHL